jgi:hypothetical protein
LEKAQMKQASPHSKNNKKINFSDENLFQSTDTSLASDPQAGIILCQKKIEKFMILRARNTIRLFACFLSTQYAWPEIHQLQP